MAIRACGQTPKDAAKPKKVTRSMLGRKSKRIGPNADRFAKRQREYIVGLVRHSGGAYVWPDIAGSKLWLETHVWHAKRMHMIDLWGHRLVSTSLGYATDTRKHHLIPTHSTRRLTAQQPRHSVRHTARRCMVRSCTMRVTTSTSR